ncbi:MAG: hypothetical protein JXC32_17820 [Anaerolineae bacterium]|nr:hypothetical protein [Anaerolineae bacterium]
MMFLCRRNGQGCQLVDDDHPIAKAFEAMMAERERREGERIDLLSPAQRKFAEGLTTALHRRRYRDGQMPPHHASRPRQVAIEAVYVLDYLCSEECQAAIEAMGAEQERGGA